jgi:hypothetical protein
MELMFIFYVSNNKRLLGKEKLNVRSIKKIMLNEEFKFRYCLSK